VRRPQPLLEALAAAGPMAAVGPVGAAGAAAGVVAPQPQLRWRQAWAWLLAASSQP
jgi:hypothetical protein